MRWLKRTLILTCTAFLFVLSINISVDAESYEMVEIENLISNGDMSSLSGWFSSSNCNKSITDDEKLKIETTIDDNPLIGAIRGGSFLELNHIYYVSFVFEQFVTSYSHLDFYLGLGQHQTMTEGFNSFEITVTSITSPDIRFYLFSNDNVIGDYILLDSVIVIDLTETFGIDKEPSLSDFETLYLASIPDYNDYGWFDEYSTFKPESYITIQQDDYYDLEDDLTAVDFRTSVVAYYGDNVDMDVYAYVYYDETIGEGNQFGADWYEYNNHPELYFNDKTHVLDWEFVDYSDYVLHLVMTDVEEDVLKRILFNRHVDESEEYFKFLIESTPFNSVRLWFEISSAFSFHVTISSVLLSRETVTENDFNIVNYIYFKMFDTESNELLPALRIGIGDTNQTAFINDFGYQYTDVSKFIVALDVGSPDPDDDYNLETHYIYELGLFSSNFVLIPGMITESELDDMFPTEICDWYQFGCHATNLLNVIVREVYVGLRINEIIASIAIVIEYAELFLATLPEDWYAIMTTVLTAVTAGLTMIFVDRML